MLNLQELRAQLVAENKTARDEQMKNARENFDQRKDVNTVLAVAAALDVAGLVKGHYGDGYRLVAGWGGWTVYADLDVNGFLEAHDKKLSDLLAGIGAVLSGADWKSYDNPAGKTRTFSISSKNVHVSVEAMLKDDSQKCRRVVVGKKVEEREVYEFRCDGEEVVT